MRVNSVFLNGGFFVWISSFTLKCNLDIWVDVANWIVVKSKKSVKLNSWVVGFVSERRKSVRDLSMYRL